jgi:hypothetical protein
MKSSRKLYVTLLMYDIFKGMLYVALFMYVIFQGVLYATFFMYDFDGGFSLWPLPPNWALYKAPL